MDSAWALCIQSEKTMTFPNCVLALRPEASHEWLAHPGVGGRDILLVTAVQCAQPVPIFRTQLRSKTKPRLSRELYLVITF